MADCKREAQTCALGLISHFLLLGDGNELLVTLHNFCSSYHR